MYSLTGSMLALSAFHGTQGMDVQKSLPKISKNELTKTVQEFKSVRINKDKHKDNFSLALSNICTYDSKYYSQEALALFEDERDEILYELVQDLKVDQRNRYNFETVLTEFTYAYKACDEEKIALVEEKRDAALHMIFEDIKIARQEEQRNRDTFKTVLCELQEQKVIEGKQEPEMPEGSAEFFVREFRIAKEDREQEAVFSNLMSSIIMAESQVQSEVEKLSDEKGAIEPVTVGLWTSLRDYWYGSSNLVSELSGDKISLDVLKKSPDMQTRINNMIASYSPSKKRNTAMLSSLLDLYTSLDTLKFKFVNADVNSDIHNACEKWRREEEMSFASFRTARVFAIMQLLDQEMQKLHQEEKPLLETINKLEQIQKLSQQTGMVEKDTQEVTADQNNILLAAKTFNVYCDLDNLCEAFKKEESAK